jgi:hypothetical protein
MHPESAREEEEHTTITPLAGLLCTQDLLLSDALLEEVKRFIDPHNRRGNDECRHIVLNLRGCLLDHLRRVEMCTWRMVTQELTLNGIHRFL